MSSQRKTPDFAWYSAEGTRLGLTSLRCPFASVHACPRYYQSLSLLGGAGCTPIPKAQDDALMAKWQKHPLWPTTGEQATSISGGDGEKNSYDKFCPEVAYDTFGLFATFLGRHVGEIDRGLAAERLAKEGAAHDDPGWIWAFVTPQHYSECPLYSPLSHDWVKHITRPVVTPADAPAAPGARFDVFISHASEDKDFARPLAHKLQALGLRVWFDESAMKPGDSLRQEIDKGLAGSDFGVAVLSKHFFKKQWTQAELNGLFTLKLEGKNRIIPVWHEITKQEVASHSPMVADLLALRAADGTDSVAVQILKVVRPAAIAVFSASLSPSDQGSTSLGGPHKGGRYSIELGKRHRHLRDKILQLNSRRMSDFYGFEKVAQLESCESGTDEFPTAAIKKLREFFFVSRDYLQGESNEIFDSFDNTCSADDCKKLLAESFQPYLLCQIEDRKNLWCWPVLHKEEEGHDRIVTAEAYGYFASGGGGKMNIMHFIEAIHHHGLKPYQVPVLRADRKTWTELETRVFYRKGMHGLRGQDGEGQDCFIAWFEEFTRQQKET
jgi:TIR domain